RVLREAGDPRTEAEMFDLATWSSYDQFRGLLEATARLFGAHELTRASSGGLTDPTMPEMTSMLQSLGRPEALLAMLAESGGARRPTSTCTRRGSTTRTRRALRASSSRTTATRKTATSSSKSSRSGGATAGSRR